METNHSELELKTTNSSAETLKDDVSEEKTWSSNHDLNSPSREESLVDKGNIKYQDELVESSSVLSEYRSDSNYLCFSTEANCDRNEESLSRGNSFDQVSRKYGSDIHDSGGDSTGGINFSSEFPSSSELIYHEIKKSTPETSESMEEVSPEGGNFLRADQDSFKPEDQESGLLRVVSNPGEEMNKNCIHLDTDDVAEEGATISNHNLTGPSKEELSLHEDNMRHPENGLMPVVSEHIGVIPTHVYSENNDVSEEKSQSSKHKSPIPPKDEWLPDKDSIMHHQDEHAEGITELFEDETVINGTSNSREVSDCGNKDSPVEESLNHSKGACSFGKDFKKCHSDLHDSDGELAGDRNLSVEFPSLNELVCYKTEELRSEINECVEEGETIDLDHCAQPDQYENEKSLEMCQEGEKFLHEIQTLSEHEYQKDRLPVPVSGQLKGGSKNEYVQGIWRAGVDSSSSETITYQNGNVSGLSEPNIEVDHAFDVTPSLKGLSSEIILNSSDEDHKDRSPPVGAENKGVLKNEYVQENDEKCLDHLADQNKSFGEGIWLAGVDSLSSETVTYQNGNAPQLSEPNVEVDHALDTIPTLKRLNTEDNVKSSAGDTNVASQNILMGNVVPVRNFRGANSVELLESRLIPDTSLQLGTNSLTIKSYYSYDGGESSKDGIGNRTSVDIPHPSRRKGKDGDHISTAEILKRDGFMANNMLKSELEMNFRALSSSSSSLRENRHHAMTGSRWDQNEFTNTKRDTRGSGYTKTLSKGATSQSQFVSRHLPADHRTRSPSIYRHALTPAHLNSHLPDKTLYSEADEMDLLRTITELKDQLNRIQLPGISRSGMFQSGVMEENFTPLYYDHSTSERNKNGKLNRRCSSYYSRYNQERGWAEQPNVSRLGLSGETAHYRHGVNRSYYHCHDQNWHNLTQLPPRLLRHESIHVVPRTDHKRFSISNSSCSQYYPASEFSVRSQETELDNQMHGDEMKRLSLRHRYHTSKKLLRPMAGGSPFVSCYHCSELLQLPENLFLFKKRYRQLRCNACHKVLKFSLVEGMHIVPYLTDCSPSSKTGKFRNQVSMPHSNSSQHSKPVSSSDDCGQAFSRSYSTEGDASAKMPPSRLIKGNRYSRKVSFASSYETIEDGKMRSIMLKEESIKEQGKFHGNL